jgi:hypothetical protein
MMGWEVKKKSERTKTDTGSDVSEFVWLDTAPVAVRLGPTLLIRNMYCLIGAANSRIMHITPRDRASAPGSPAMPKIRPRRHVEHLGATYDVSYIAISLEQPPKTDAADDGETSTAILCARPDSADKRPRSSVAVVAEIDRPRSKTLDCDTA